MRSADGKLQIVFNGEVFNYRELRRSLHADGHRFRTNSDTEVVLAAYQAWGGACVERLHGLFAFAIRDTGRDLLFCARDRFGIKPLYWAESEGTLVFASEIPALYATGRIRFEPNVQHLNEFLVFGSVAGSETLHRGVRELPAGHVLRFEGDRVTVSRYWSPFERGVAPLELSDDPTPAAEELERRLEEAVWLWTTADVEVASLLSGGIDSSLLTQMAAELIPDLHTWSACFEKDPALDERPLVERTLSRLDCVPTFVPIDDDYLLAQLDRLIVHTGDPIHDPNHYTLMALCDGIRQRSDVKVLLCGEGADELFGGYARHAQIPAEYARNGDPDTLVYAMNRVALPRLRRFADDVSITNRTRWDLLEASAATDPVDRALALDQQPFLQSYLHRQDRVGMLFGFEIRTPFLEHQVAEYANALPANWKIHQGWHKWILRRVAERRLPREVVWNRTKTAFSFPVQRMLASGPLRSRFEALLASSPRLADHYDIGGIRSLLADHAPDRGANHANTLWRLLTLELWLRTADRWR